MKTLKIFLICFLVVGINSQYLLVKLNEGVKTPGARAISLPKFGKFQVLIPSASAIKKSIYR